MKTSPDFDWNSSFFSDYQNYFQKAYQLQTDLEEAKRQEILKLQYSMQAIQAKVDETNALLTKEREFAHIRIAHQVAHFQLIQNAREKGALQEAKDKLQAQVEDLTLHLELEKRLKTDLEEAKGHEILELQNSVQAMQAKVNVTNALLTMDRESAQKKIDKLSAQVEELKSLLELERNRKQCESSEIKPDQLLVSMNRLEEKLTNIESENKVLRQQVLAMAAQLKSILDLHSPLMHLRDADVEKRLEKSLSEKQQEYDEDWLIRCITQHLGFSKGRPIAACVIYKCLGQWRSFDIKETNIFDLITKTIGQAIKTQYKNNEVLAYWLSNVSTLLLLLRHEQDEVFCHALVFKEKLTEYAQKIYGMIRDNLKKEILPLLKLCIQAPIDFGPELLNRTDASPDILIAHWQAIVNNFDCFLNILKSNNVPPFFVRKIFTQNFSFINAMLFSSLVWRVESCSISNSEYVKAGLSKLEHWCYKASEEYAGSAWDELKDIRQAVVLLVLDQNPKKTLDKMIHEISFCPIVIPILRMLFEEDCSYFPDERSSIPLSVYDISKSIESMDEINIEDVEPPPLICEILPKSLWPSGIKSVGKGFKSRTNMLI